MANETTYSAISALLNPVIEATLMYLQYNTIMPNLVSVETDMAGMQPRIFNQYASGTVATGLAETDNLDSFTQAFTKSALGTVTPAEIGTQFFITDRRLDSDIDNVLADLTSHIQYTVARQIDVDLMAFFGSLAVNGTVGTAGATLTWQQIYAARARLAGTGVPGPYNVVVHEFQWYKLASALNIAGGMASPANLQIRNTVQNQYYVGSIGDMDFYATGIPSAGTAVKACVFARPAFIWDVRRGLRLEPQRDASRRGIEVNVSMIYGAAKFREVFGVQLIGDASTPT